MSTEKGMKVLRNAVGVAAAIMMLMIAMPARAQAPYGVMSSMSTPYPGNKK